MFSEDLCWRIVHLKFQFHFTSRRIAQLLNISNSTVDRTLTRFITTGEVHHKTNGRPKSTTLHPHDQLVLVETLSENPATTLKEQLQKISNATGNHYDLSTISRNIRRFGFTRKRVFEIFNLLILS